jgi:hypothetical protein
MRSYDVTVLHRSLQKNERSAPVLTPLAGGLLRLRA